MSLLVRMGALLTSLVTMKLRTLGSRVKSELSWAKSGTYTIRGQSPRPNLVRAKVGRSQRGVAPNLLVAEPPSDSPQSAPPETKDDRRRLLARTQSEAAD